MQRLNTRRRGHLRRCRPGFDALESRQLLAVVYQSYGLPDLTSTAGSIVVGPNNQIWFDYYPGMPGSTGIGKIDPATGVIATFPHTSNGNFLGPIVSGPGGDLWFAGAQSIGIFDPTKDSFSSVSLHSNVDPLALAIGADGNVYFTDSFNSAIGVVNALTHAVTEFPAPRAGVGLNQIVAGPGGDLWFTERGAAGKIGSFNPTTHAFAEYPLPSSNRFTASITVGADGGIYFDEFSATGPVSDLWANYLARIDPSSHAITEYSTSIGLSSGSLHPPIASGPDGNIWFTAGNVIGMLNPSTTAVSTFSLYGGLFDAASIVTGPDGNLWVGANGYIAKVSIVPASQGAIQGNVDLDPTTPGSLSGGPLVGKTVYLDLQGDGKLDPGDPTAVTDAFGSYAFNDLAPGTYTVRAAAFAGDTLTAPAGGAGTTVTGTAGSVAAPSAIGMVPTSSLMPLGYNPAPFGTHNPDVQTAEVSGLYRLMLGRAPDAAGGAAAVSFLKGGGSLTQLSANLLTSTEYDTDAVNAYYRSYLRRAPDAAGGAAAVAFLQHGGSRNRIAENLLDSAEYSTLFSSNATFVQALYGDILGRLPSPSEVAAGASLLGPGYSRSQYVAFLIGSTESDNRGVQGVYATVMARAADYVGLPAAVAALQGGSLTLEGLASSLLGSGEFIARANATVG